jgi:predicted DNA-binding protein
MTSIEIPPTLYQRLERVAQLTHRPLEVLVQQTLEAGVPPLPENLPPAMRDDLAALESLNDGELWRVAQSEISAEEATLQAELLEKNSRATIREQERETLANLRAKADQLMLRKAYAYVLLKWRGHRLTPAHVSPNE